jgi:hypothetical protein
MERQRIGLLLAALIPGLFLASLQADADEKTAQTSRGDTKIVYNKVEDRLVLSGKLGDANMFKAVATTPFTAEVDHIDTTEGKLYFKNVKFTVTDFELQFGLDAVITFTPKDSDITACKWLQKYKYRDTSKKENAWTDWTDDPVSSSGTPDCKTEDTPTQSVSLGLKFEAVGPAAKPTSIKFSPETAPSDMATTMKKLYSANNRTIEYEFKTTLVVGSETIGSWSWGYVNKYDGTSGSYGVVVTPKVAAWSAGP